MVYSVYILFFLCMKVFFYSIYQLLAIKLILVIVDFLTDGLGGDICFNENETYCIDVIIIICRYY